MNRDDAWSRHREAAKLAEIGLPSTVYDSEQTLAEFLTSGRREIKSQSPQAESCIQLTAPIRRIIIIPDDRIR